MILKQCENGHFYDGEKYPSCPHCAGGAASMNRGDDVTVPADVTMPNFVSTVGTSDTVPADFGGAVNMGASFGFGGSDDEGVTVPLGGDVTIPQNTVPADDDEGLTQGWDPFAADPVHMSGAQGNVYGYVNVPRPPVVEKTLSPIVGWLVCISGMHIGRDFRLVAGKNTIGRSENNNVALTGDKSVSRDAQAIVAYDPKSNAFFAVSGNAQSLCYLNGQVLLTQAVLKKNDILEVGDEKLVFVPLCDQSFNWNTFAAK